MIDLRPAAVAGTWYPGSAEKLSAAVDQYLDASGDTRLAGDVVALIAPHAGLMYSGPVAAHAYHQLRQRPIDSLVLVGPSHFLSFEGVALYARGGFASPLGPALIDESLA